jgi:predicted enzyme related to lactoylglutathione lyase
VKLKGMIMHIRRHPVRTILWAAIDSYLGTLLGAFVGASLLSAAAVAAPLLDLPPLSSPQSREHHSGKMIWADLVTPELGNAERFYGGLFGWSFRDIHTADTDYAVATLNGRPVAGLVQRAIPAGDQKQPAWLTFLAVRDVDTAVRLARGGGATVLAEPRSYRGRGRQAVLSDPEGAVFAMLASSSGDPGDFLAAPGEWIWVSLLAKDPGATAAFYKKTFGYDVFELPQEGTAVHIVLSSDDYARAGVNSLPQDSKRRHPHWLNFVRVADAADTAAKAVSLGGRTLVDPYVDRHGGRIAVLADPAGAPFGVMEWTGNDSKVEPK